MVESGAQQNLLIVRLSSLGDLVHTIPAVAALREAFPQARIDWVVEKKWSPLVEMVRGVDNVIPRERSALGTLLCMNRLRQGHYTCAIDFQGLYKSALLTWVSRAPRRIGRDRKTARESGAAAFYTDRVAPQGTHIAEMNLSLANHAGAQSNEMIFPIEIPKLATQALERELSQDGLADYVLLSPGGGWKSKCWPPERYGLLCEALWRRNNIRSLINAGPGEEDLARSVARAAGASKPRIVSASLIELAAMAARARLVIAADTGPLHLAAALGAPVVALFGPTDPDRNGPLPRGRVVRDIMGGAAAARSGDDHARGQYNRGDDYSQSMLAISVEQVLDAAEEEMGVGV